MNGSTKATTLFRLSGDDRGAMLPIMALVVVLAVSGAALAVDVARAHALRHQLQLTADAAALAAAVNLPDKDAARIAARRYAARNMPEHALVVADEDIEFGHWNPDTRQIEPEGDVPSAVRVTTSLSAAKGNALTALFAGFLGSQGFDVSASAAAGKRSPTCILALDPEGVSGVRLDVAARIDAANCTAQINSRHDSALRMLLGSRFLASGICVTGDAHVGVLARVSPEPSIGCPPQPDPLAALESPETDGCDFSGIALSGHHGTLQPGIYCGGLSIDGASKVDLAAGVYVIKDGLLSIGDDSEVSGDGITFYLTGKNTLIRFADDSVLTLTAPTDGDMAGILVFQDRNFGGRHIWNSDAPAALHGTIYLPEGLLISESSNAITPVGSCNVLIAKNVRLKLKSAISIDLGQKRCESYLPAAVLGTVALLD